MLRSTPAGPPRGRFLSNSTRDGEARARHGHEFQAVRRLGETSRGEPLYELQFYDGLWMLATAADLDLYDGSTGTHATATKPGH